MTKMSEFPYTSGATVLTGAASGIGDALARGLALRGVDLAVIDKNAEGLAALAADLRAKYPRLNISTHAVDLSDADQIAALPEAVKSQHRRVSMLINNAGVALGGAFQDVSLADFEFVMDVNFWATIRMTKAFLPDLLEAAPAQLVNLSSLFGIIGVPGQAAYSSRKFGVRGFSEALRPELAHQGVKVLQVHPGGIKTNIANAARIGENVRREQVGDVRSSCNKLLTMEPRVAAEQILAAVAAGKNRLVITKEAKFLDVIARLMPSNYGSTIGKLMAQKSGISAEKLIV